VLRIKKVKELIEKKIYYHSISDHTLRIGGLPTGLTLNDAVSQLIEHLGLEIDMPGNKLIDKSLTACATEESKGKPVATVEMYGLIHLASKTANPKLVSIRPADEVTCRQCRRKLEAQGFLTPIQDRK